MAHVEALSSRVHETDAAAQEQEAAAAALQEECQQLRGVVRCGVAGLWNKRGGSCLPHGESGEIVSSGNLVSLQENRGDITHMHVDGGTKFTFVTVLFASPGGRVQRLQ